MPTYRLLAVALAAAATLSACGGSSKPSSSATPSSSGPASSATPSTTAGGEGIQKFANLSHDHTQRHVKYAETPPVGGPHNAYWLRCAVYTQPVPNENAVHSLEHGAVWVTYRPSLTADDVQKLTALRSIDPAYFLLSPYADLPAPVVASAWGLQLQVQSAGDPRLAQFVKDYAGGGQGGEKGADCAHGLPLDKALQSIEPGPTVTATPR